MLTLAEPSRVVEVVVILVTARAIWLLPDWFGKWQRLFARRRAARERA